MRFVHDRYGDFVLLRPRVTAATALLCPGPALAGLGLASRPVAVFVAAMLAGMALFEALGRAKPRGNASAPVASASGAGR